MSQAHFSFKIEAEIRSLLFVLTLTISLYKLPVVFVASTMLLLHARVQNFMTFQKSVTNFVRCCHCFPRKDFSISLRKKHQTQMLHCCSLRQTKVYHQPSEICFRSVYHSLAIQNSHHYLFVCLLARIQLTSSF